VSTADRKRILLGSEKHRRFVGDLVAKLDRGWVVTLQPPRRTISQNDTYWMLVADAVAGGLATDSGRRLTKDEAHVAFVTAWMRETGEASDVIAFDGHAVQLRRSTTTFDKGELSSLIESVMAACAKRGIALRDPEAR
jgi:hypothetical protein